MRAACLALAFVAACATTSPAPPERLAGCWIARGENDARTMRWMPDPTLPGVLNGDLLVYTEGAQPQRSHFTLEPRDAGWVFCADETGGRHCRDVALGAHGSLEGGRIFIDRFAESLRISLIGEGPEQLIFLGQRDGCD